MKTYKITEVSVYYVEANNNDEAFEKFSELDNSAASKVNTEIYEVTK